MTWWNAASSLVPSNFRILSKTTRTLGVRPAFHNNQVLATLLTDRNVGVDCVSLVILMV